MARKAKRKKKGHRKPNESQVGSEPTRDVEGTKEDYGGLPERDLKKNLGCG
jgi:hypothetical protein